MHEVGVAEEVLKKAKQIAKDNSAPILKGIGVSIGTLSGVEPFSFEFALKALVADTELKDVAFDIKIIKAKGVCSDCGRESEPDSKFAICGHCGSIDYEITEGTEFNITYIDV